MVSEDRNVVGGSLSEIIRDNINREFMDLFHSAENDSDKPYVCMSCDIFIKRKDVFLISIPSIYHVKNLLTCPDISEDFLDNEDEDSNPFEVPPELSALYRFRVKHNDRFQRNSSFHNGTREQEWWKDLYVSPRSQYIINTNGQYKHIGGDEEGFCICSQCYRNLIHANERPYYSISNNWFFGCPPKVLLDLTEVELGVVTPVRVYGYCYAFTGGEHKEMKGSLSYYQIQHETVARRASHFKVLGMTENVVIILYGKMTLEQNKKLKRKNKLRTNYVLRAVEWLCAHNEEWKKRNVDLQKFEQELINPHLVDNSIVIKTPSSCSNSNASNIEQTESFEVFFPDGAVNNFTGGRESVSDLKEMINSLNKAGFEFTMKSNIYAEVVGEYKDNVLVNACLLQYPFGRGGLEDKHYDNMNKKSEYELKTHSNVIEYTEHLARLSQPQFHRSLFCLILFNLKMKQLMVRNACFKVRGKQNAEMLSEKLTQDAVDAAIHARRRGVRDYTEEGRGGELLLSAVDAVVGGVPHTNQATKRARRHAEAILHAFGLPSVFLTVTPDDDNSYLLEVLSKCNNDYSTNESVGTSNTVEDSTSTSGCNYDNSMKESMARTQLRIKLPGLSSIAFEYLLEIVLEEVVGWDVKLRKPRDDYIGLFGNVEAFTCTVEEQGRKTLHAHFQIWINKYNIWRENLNDCDRGIQREARRNMEVFVDDISSNMLISSLLQGRSRQSKRRQVFDHVCSPASVGKSKRYTISMSNKELQDLRNLRSSIVYRRQKNNVLFCKECGLELSNEELMTKFLRYNVGLHDIDSYSNLSTKRYLKSKVLDYQKSSDIQPKGDMIQIIDAAYNCHCHNERGCFRRDREVGRKTKERGCECRYRFPRPPTKQTKVEEITKDKVSWYKFSGEDKPRHLYEIRPRRGRLDVYQNDCCPAVSHSKLSCNTNISAVMTGPMGMYCFKYNTKDTQKDDTEEYERVAEAVRKSLTKHQNCDASNTKIGVNRILSSSFAHAKTNVISAPLASYILRNNSRFIFSHDAVWCPLRDIKKILFKESIDDSVIVRDNIHSGYYFINSAMNYLCRPKELERLSPKKFYENYEVVRKKANDSDILMFEPCGDNMYHPSYYSKKKTYSHGVKKRCVKCIVKVYQWDFPDTASFGAKNILHNDTIITEKMEQYAEMVLLLLTSFRKLNDLRVDGSYVKKFRLLYQNEKIRDTEMRYLQNLQDSKANNMRHYEAGLSRDYLCRRTEMYQQSTMEVKINETNDIYGEDNEDDSEIDENEAIFAQDFCDLIIHNNANKENIECMNFKAIKDRGCNDAATRNIASVDFDDKWTTAPEKAYAIDQQNGQSLNDLSCENEGNSQDVAREYLRKVDIITLMAERRTRIQRSFGDIVSNNDGAGVQQNVKDVCDADGTAKSIIDWANCANLDKGQRRAFEVICSQFVLTQYDRAHDDDISLDENETYVMRRKRAMFSKELMYLQKLNDRVKRTERTTGVSPKSNEKVQLISLLHGPAGCGKTTVIDLIIEYARQFCKNLRYDFTTRTIVVSALTGVAATHLNGETVHSALHLNRKKGLEPEQIENWEQTVLLIIDEISFASGDDIRNIDQKLRMLKQCTDQRFGGLDIVFAGDFRQLKPVRAKAAIYGDGNCPQFWDWINCYFELEGMHRFSKDEEWGKILRRMRNGQVQHSDIKKINERVVKDTRSLPRSLKYAVFFNRDRDAINIALFEKRACNMQRHLQTTDDMIMILSDELEICKKDKTCEPLKNRCVFWEGCGEHNLKSPSGFGGRVDPVLRVYRGCELMLTANVNVTGGMANGTRIIFERVILKPGENVAGKIKIFGNCDAYVNYIFASQVKHVVAKHVSSRVQNPTLHLKPVKKTFLASFPPSNIDKEAKNLKSRYVKMKGLQMPFVVNNATTGHKLQGCGVKTLYVHKFYPKQDNWDYVVMSRVKERSGLFLGAPLNSKPEHFNMDTSLFNMLQKFRDKKPQAITDDDYTLIEENKLIVK